MIGIIDYGVGNVSAIKSVFDRLDIESRFIRSLTDFEGISHLILPGVGSFDFAMERLNKSGLREKIDYLVLKDKTPVLGICVGMQMMFENSQEGDCHGLSWLKGKVRKFDTSLLNHRVKLPHMGWNNIVVQDCDTSIFSELSENPHFYFLHSYRIDRSDEFDEVAFTHYGEEFTAAFKKDNIVGIQFHPEKSHSNGEKILKNFFNHA